MRKILVTLSFVLMISVSAMANVYLDVYGTFLTSGDAEYQYGAGGALGVDFVPDISFIYRGMYAFSTFDGDTLKEKKYGYMLQMLGVEYNYPVPKAYMGWKSSVMIGISELSIEEKKGSLDPANPTDSRTRKEMGFTVGIWTGVKFDVSQHVAPFIDLGYHYSFFSGSLEDELIHGVHLMFGVRFTLWKKSRDIYRDY
ncbi:MAG TPA: hypothetical protein PK926_14175 [Spirochaetota bacterium]|nr:hypothetical protein [Spirochaetota bacterium]HPI88275.1 hypothetical protein [Spirochaetota bacterium]HPR49195.1 hypothetical protein [Spirochaetota bacterium]